MINYKYSYNGAVTIDLGLVETYNAAIGLKELERTRIKKKKYVYHNRVIATELKRLINNYNSKIIKRDIVTNNSEKQLKDNDYDFYIDFILNGQDKYGQGYDALDWFLHLIAGVIAVTTLASYKTFYNCIIKKDCTKSLD